MTIIVVPEAGRRTVTFKFSLYWLLPLVVALIGLPAAVHMQYRQNQAMQDQLSELDRLRRTNRLQESEIEGLQAKANQTDDKLTELQALETQIRDLVGQPLPSRGGGGSLQQLQTDGRGGPSEASLVLTNMPTLSAMLPPEVRTYLFAKRDTLPMQLETPAAYGVKPPRGTETTDQLSARMDEQLTAIERLSAELTESKDAVAEHIDYLAHLPSGWPVTGGAFTDRYGWRWSPFGWGRQWHDGLDIAQDYGVPVAATADGVVIHSGWKSGGYGYTVMVDHGYGMVTMYAHMSDTKPDLWQEVKRGEVVGWVGSTGNSTGPHLHYEVHVNGVPDDPAKYLQ
jgi:murein DD-endopeptidase MepM/ murein hydrolase activator NlpD